MQGECNSFMGIGIGKDTEIGGEEEEVEFSGVRLGIWVRECKILEVD